MSSDPKDLQRLAETKSPVTALDWSTISNVHGKQAESADNLELVKALQALPAPAGVIALEWSTISNVHGHK